MVASTLQKGSKAIEWKQYANKIRKRERENVKGLMKSESRNACKPFRPHFVAWHPAVVLFYFCDLANKLSDRKREREEG